MGLPEKLLENVDFTQPGAYAFFLAILVLLPYWYYHEGAEVHREFSRLYREISKEDKLQKAFTNQWMDRFETSIAFFGLGIWFVCAWTTLLLLVCGLVFIHGAQIDNIRQVFAVSKDQNHLMQLEKNLKLRLAPEHFARCVFLRTEEIPMAFRNLTLSNKKIDLSSFSTPSLTVREEIALSANLFDVVISKNVKMSSLLPETSQTADFIVQRKVEGFFSDQIACQICDSRSVNDDTDRVVSCINAGWRRRQAQKLIGGGYIVFCVAAVLYVKRKKSVAFTEMKKFSSYALSLNRLQS